LPGTGTGLTWRGRRPRRPFRRPSRGAVRKVRPPLRGVCGTWPAL